MTDTPSKAAAAAVVVLLGLLAVRFRRPLLAALRRFFTQPSTAFNLAVFRIVFFTGVGALLLFEWDVATVRGFSELPRELIVPPQVLGGIAEHIPLSPTLVVVAYGVALVSCALACLGLFTRAACWAFVLSLGYYLTVPQLFGKIDHYHHVLWLGLIFAVSRSGDTLSLDAARQAWRREPGAEIVQPPARLQYSLPLRFTWLLLGVIYLFPGLWKYRVDGLKWLDPSTLERLMYNKWYELDGWRPLARIDEVPFALSLGAGYTLLFECFFLLLVVFPRVRPFLAVAGLGFHNSTNLLMKIPFYSLQFVYVSLIDWERLSERLSNRRGALLFGFDGSCGVCRKTVGSLAALSLPGGVRYLDVLDDEALSGTRMARLDRASLVTELHVTQGDRVWRGYDAYRRLAWRVPPMWPVLPLLYLPPVKYVGDRVYSRVAWSRVCGTSEAPAPSTPARRVLAPAFTGRGIVPVCAVGAVLFLGAMVTGVAGVGRGWPLSHYPTFAGLGNGNEKEVLLIEGTTPAGVVERVDLSGRLAFMPSQRFHALVAAVLREPRHERTGMMRALLGAAPPVAPDGSPFESITVRQATVSTEPEQAGKVLASTKLLTLRGAAGGRLAGAEAKLDSTR